jgi:4-carboxymuconolactone decarboxylase
VGRELGITEEQLRELSQYQRSYAFTELEKVVLDLAVAMTRTPADISDELFEKVQRHFSSPQLVELVMAIAYANFRARFNRSFDIQAADLSKGAYRPLPER